MSTTTELKKGGETLELSETSWFVVLDKHCLPLPRALTS